MNKRSFVSGLLVSALLLGTTAYVVNANAETPTLTDDTATGAVSDSISSSGIFVYDPGKDENGADQGKVVLDSGDLKKIAAKQVAADEQINALAVSFGDLQVALENTVTEKNHLSADRNGKTLEISVVGDNGEVTTKSVIFVRPENDDNDYYAEYKRYETMYQAANKRATSFDINGGNSGGAATKTYPIGASIICPVAVKDDTKVQKTETKDESSRTGKRTYDEVTSYSLSGWYTQRSGGTKVGDAGDTVTQGGNDVTYYAQYAVSGTKNENYSDWTWTAKGTTHSKSISEWSSDDGHQWYLSGYESHGYITGAYDDYYDGGGSRHGYVVRFSDGGSANYISGSTTVSATY